MKLQELAGIKRFRQMTPAETIRYLKKEFAANKTSLKFLGSGANAIALTNGKDVFKFWYADSGYEKFVQLSKANQDNPWFPKFKSDIKTLPRAINIFNRPSPVRYVKMELLKPWHGPSSIKLYDRSIDREQFSHEIQLHLLAELGFSRVFHALEDSESSDPVEGVISWVADNDGLKPADVKPLRKYVNPEFVLLATAAQGILNFLERRHQHLDLHSGNWALRGDHPVILDPVADEVDMDLTDEFMTAISGIDTDD